MTIFSRYTIRTRLTIILMAVSAAAIVLAGLSAFAIGVYMGVQSLKSDLVATAQVLGDNCQASLTFAVPDDSRAILATLQKKTSINAAAIFDADGKPFAEYSPKGRRPPAVFPGPIPARVSWSSAEVILPITLKGKLLGHIYLRNDLGQARLAFFRYLAAIVFFMILSFGVTSFLALRLRGAIATPILNLANVTRNVSLNQDYSIRATRASDDEIGELIDSFNHMLEQIQSRERSLRASEEKFSQAFNLSPAMMILVDYETREVSDINAAWLAVLGKSRAEVVGRQIDDFHLPVEPRVYELIRDRLVTEGQVRGAEIVINPGQDEERTLIVSIEVIEIGGRRYIIAVGDDVSESRRLAEQLLHAHKMEAVGRLAGGVAHDFNNMLAGIRGYAELMTMRLAPDDHRKYAGSIVQLTERAAGLTRQLLAFSRRGKIKETQVDVHDLIHEVTSLLAHTIDRRIAIKSSLDAPRHVVTGDPSQLLNAILNIAVNARDAMPDGGILTIASAVVSADEARAAGLEESPAPEYLRLTISDTGVGMEENVKRHIFEPFFTTKQKGRGTGLGLAAVYGTVKEHQGEIKVESESGRGSSFLIYLPLSEILPGKIETREEALPRGKGLILLVDDEDVLREISRRMLEELGYEVVEAQNGRRAVEIYSARRDRIRLVILDVIMPEMNGIEAFAQIRNINPEARVLIASGFIPDQQMIGLLKQGIHGVLMKPFTMKDLSLRLAEIIPPG